MDEAARLNSDSSAARVTFVVRVQPRAKRNLIVADQNLLKLYVTAPAEAGRANAAALELIAEWLHVKRRQLSILSGTASRNKVIAATGIAQSDLARAIERVGKLS